MPTHLCCVAAARAFFAFLLFSEIVSATTRSISSDGPIACNSIANNSDTVLELVPNVRLVSIAHCRWLNANLTMTIADGSATAIAIDDLVMIGGSLQFVAQSSIVSFSLTLRASQLHNVRHGGTLIVPQVSIVAGNIRLSALHPTAVTADATALSVISQAKVHDVQIHVQGATLHVRTTAPHVCDRPAIDSVHCIAAAATVLSPNASRITIMIDSDGNVATEVSGDDPSDTDTLLLVGAAAVLPRNGTWLACSKVTRIVGGNAELTEADFNGLSLRTELALTGPEQHTSMPQAPFGNVSEADIAYLKQYTMLKYDPRNIQWHWGLNTSETPTGEDMLFLSFFAQGDYAIGLTTDDGSLKGPFSISYVDPSDNPYTADVFYSFSNFDFRQTEPQFTRIVDHTLYPNGSYRIMVVMPVSRFGVKKHQMQNVSLVFAILDNSTLLPRSLWSQPFGSSVVEIDFYDITRRESTRTISASASRRSDTVQTNGSGHPDETHSLTENIPTLSRSSSPPLSPASVTAEQKHRSATAEVPASVTAEQKQRSVTAEETTSVTAEQKQRSVTAEETTSVTAEQKQRSVTSEETMSVTAEQKQRSVTAGVPTPRAPTSTLRLSLPSVSPTPSGLRSASLSATCGLPEIRVSPREIRSIVLRRDLQATLNFSIVSPSAPLQRFLDAADVETQIEISSASGWLLPTLARPSVKVSSSGTSLQLQITVPDKSVKVYEGSTIRIRIGSGAFACHFEEDFITSVDCVPLARPVPVTAVNVIESVSMTTAAVSSAIGTPTIAVQQSRIAAVISLSSCQFSHNEPIHRFKSPLGWSVGDATGSYYRGALVGNFVIFLGVLVLSAFFTLLLYNPSTSNHRGIMESLQLLHLPGLLAVPIALLCQGTVSVATSLFNHGTHPVDKHLCWTTATIVILLWVAVMYVVTIGFQCESTIRPSVVLDSTQASWRRWIIECLFSSTKWRDKLKVDPATGKSVPRGFKQHWQPLFIDYREGYQWYFGFEMSLAIIVGIMEGVKDPDTCKEILWVFVALVAFHTMAAVLLRPFAAPFNTFFHITISLGTCMAVGVGAASSAFSDAESDGYKNTVAVSQWFALAVQFISVIKLGFDALMLFRWFHSRYLRHQHERLTRRLSVYKNHRKDVGELPPAAEAADDVDDGVEHMHHRGLVSLLLDKWFAWHPLPTSRRRFADAVNDFDEDLELLLLEVEHSASSNLCHVASLSPQHAAATTVQIDEKLI